MGTTLTRLKTRIKDRTKLVLSIASVLFWLAAHHICTYVYPDASTDADSSLMWWYLKSDFYVLIICICYYLMTIKGSTIKRIKFIEDFMIQFGVIFASSNVIDRWILDSRIFTWSAYYPLVLIAIVSYYNVKRITKEAEKHANNLTE
jgi:hypothetical protein